MFTGVSQSARISWMKVFPDYAGPATSEITIKLLRIGQKGETTGNGRCPPYLTLAKYFEHLKTLIDFGSYKKAQRAGI